MWGMVARPHCCCRGPAHRSIKGVGTRDRASQSHYTHPTPATVIAYQGAVRGSVFSRLWVRLSSAESWSLLALRDHLNEVNDLPKLVLGLGQRCLKTFEVT